MAIALLTPVAFSNAPFPIAMLSEPVKLDPSESQPIPMLSLPVVLLISDPAPSATL